MQVLAMELMEWWKTALSKRICKNSSVLHINISVINSSYGCFVVAFVGLLAASENAKYVDLGVYSVPQENVMVYVVAHLNHLPRFS